MPVRPQERVLAMPKLYRANAFTCGLLRCGMWLDTAASDSRNRFVMDAFGVFSARADRGPSLLTG
jgi:hypothetical protein